LELVARFAINREKLTMRLILDRFRQPYEWVNAHLTKRTLLQLAARGIADGRSGHGAGLPRRRAAARLRGA